MEIFQDIQTLPTNLRGAVVAIGNFDGVHKGHQALLARARAMAGKKGVKWGVLTFEPHPRSLFQPDSPPFRITPPDLKAERMALSGADFLCMAEFNWDLAGLSPQSFIEDVLKKALGASHIVVGYDFRFGQFRKGAPSDIEASGLSLSVVEEVADEGEAEVSSSKVRQYLRKGEMREADKILGWDWEMRGQIVKGDQRGRELGYPTANFALGDLVHPKYGIYAARVQVEGENEWHDAAINIGIRPMFELKTAQVESYIFDFDREIYGKILRVRPVAFIRSEAKFASLEDLINQMEKDCAHAREVLAQEARAQ